MRISKCWLMIAFYMVLLTACGSRLTGTYQANVRLVTGQSESLEPGYSFAEMKAKIQNKPRTLILHANGRYVWNTGSSKNEGRWRVEGGMLILRDDISNGIRIQPVLQSDRKWRIGPQGEFIDSGLYQRYNIEIVYCRR